MFDGDLYQCLVNQPLFQALILLPIRWNNMIKRLPKEHLPPGRSFGKSPVPPVGHKLRFRYWLDFCWCANFVGVSFQRFWRTFATRDLGNWINWMNSCSMNIFFWLCLDMYIYILYYIYYIYIILYIYIIYMIIYV